MAEAVESLLCIHKGLSSNPSPTKKIKRHYSWNKTNKQLYVLPPGLLPCLNQT
jgi:hypothetical protein